MRRVAWILLVAMVSATSLAAPAKVERNSKALEFSYEWPAEAAAIPALSKRFRGDLDRAFRRASADARDDQKLAEEQKRDFNPHFYSMNWTTSGQSASLLSLESGLGVFTGGAHPNAVYGALLWDRRLRREIKFGDQFLQPGAFATLTRTAYCKKLDAERLKRREGEKLGGEFDKCPPFSDLAIAPADSDKDGRFDIIRFTASPYTAGPYAEGEYVLELPMTRQLMAAIKPVYRSSYEPQRQ
ncbi:PdaC/SigV domain-containing protein [Sphingomonas hankyongi]|uniref:DUF4163 domain-containing protein n=1 Tax=Sphingomonas hankyongi TaxID=2908209 RepID=A0ABT0RYE5_9SPHN|nr:DUF4163 domain-containing protein [Sphingomonas hankyongi]MCL6728640.1 DUF4163 domain-containing protein [Sphingomonas hankyongi]